MLEECIEAPPPKRARLGLAADCPNRDNHKQEIVLRHPLGVRPSGNAYTATSNAKEQTGSFAALPDELMTTVLEFLTASDLLRLGGTCRALHAFTRNEELWRSLFVESNPKSTFTWQQTWRSTLLAQAVGREPRVDCSSLYSDVLHRPFFCAHVSLASYSRDIPSRNEIARLDDLTAKDFQSSWVNEPFILTKPVKQWPLYDSWDIEYLLEHYKDVAFRAESVDWPMSTYVDYMRNSQDESPLYLFDRSFAEKMQLKISTGPDPSADYWPPQCFGFDAFSVLGDARPDHRWLIVGPARSGSTFHKDPNATSAWNAVIRGSKYWIMFRSSPSIPPPPGVFISEDQSEVTSPLSIAEWLLGYHAEARQTVGCREGICREGEILYVPSGWYHLVLNLEPSIALTQNFVPRARVSAVLTFLRDQKQSISGFSDAIDDPYQLFVDRLEAAEPQLLQGAIADMADGQKSRWQAITKTADDAAGVFSFGFAEDDAEADIP